VKDQPQTGKAFGALAIEFQRLLDKRKCSRKRSAQVFDLAQSMERIETLRPVFERGTIKPLGALQFAGFMGALRTPQEARAIRLQSVHRRVVVH
jgi:hypothetical protein